MLTRRKCVFKTTGYFTFFLKMPHLYPFLGKIIQIYTLKFNVTQIDPYKLGAAADQNHDYNS